MRLMRGVDPAMRCIVAVTNDFRFLKSLYMMNGADGIRVAAGPSRRGGG